MQEPVDAIAGLAKAVETSKRTGSVSFPIEYVRSAADDPPAAKMARSSETRLKLHMLFVMQATRAPYTLPDRPSTTLARNLNLPGESGRRQVADAKRWLIQQRLLRKGSIKSTGKPALELRSIGGEKEWSLGPRYVSVPIVFWSNAWILRLRGVEIAVLLALLELTGGSDHPQGEWMDGYRKKQYGLSDDTWSRATSALEQYGLLQATQVFEGDDDHEVRPRKRYLVEKEMMSKRPVWTSARP